MKNRTSFYSIQAACKHALALGSVLLVTSVMAQTDGASMFPIQKNALPKVKVEVTPEPKSSASPLEASGSVFPIDRDKIPLLPSEGSAPTTFNSDMQSASSPAKSEESVAEEGDDYPLRLNHVQPSDEKKIRILFWQTGEQSANTGQITCWSWARAMNISNSPTLSNWAPFHAALAPKPTFVTVDGFTFYNTTGVVGVTPLASKWDAPVWIGSSYWDSRSTLSALYRGLKQTTGNTNVLVGWDIRWIVTMQHMWLDGLAKSGEMDQVQAAGWKQRIAPWKVSEPNRLDIMSFELKDGKFKNFQWTTTRMNVANNLYSCSK